MYHFGYGSNLNSKFVADLLPSAKFVMKAFLPNFEVQFRYWSEEAQGGYSTIVDAPGELVHGALYKVPQDELIKLDNHKYYHNLYKRESFLLLGEDNQWHIGDLYILLDLQGPFTPDKSYLATMLEGARQIQLDPEYIKKLESFMP